MADHGGKNGGGKGMRTTTEILVDRHNNEQMAT